MIRKKRELYTYQRQKIKNNCTHRGVPQGRKKLHCGTPFLMVRNLSDFSFCCSLSVAYLCAKFGWNYSVLEGDSTWVYCFMVGCFESMDFCVSHTCFISFFTSSTSALYTLPVAFIRLAIWFKLPLIFPSV